MRIWARPHFVGYSCNWNTGPRGSDGGGTTGTWADVRIGRCACTAVLWSVHTVSARHWQRSCPTPDLHTNTDSTCLCHRSRSSAPPPAQRKPPPPPPTPTPLLAPASLSPRPSAPSPPLPPYPSTTPPGPTFFFLFFFRRSLLRPNYCLPFLRCILYSGDVRAQLLPSSLGQEHPKRKWGEGVTQRKEEKVKRSYLQNWVSGAKIAVLA